MFEKIRKLYNKLSGNERKAYEQWLWSEYKSGPIAQRRQDYVRRSFPMVGCISDDARWHNNRVEKSLLDS
jgi:hypothetical protein